MLLKCCDSVTEGLVRLGSEKVEYRVRLTDADAYPEPVRLMSPDEALCLVRTGLFSADRAECERVLRELGDPPDRLDLVFGVGTIADGEWVYAARGLTLGSSRTPA